MRHRVSHRKLGRVTEHRIAMLRYGLPDIRMLYSGDMRFLAQFGELGQ